MSQLIELIPPADLLGDPIMQRGANLSACGLYRWTLSRVWSGQPALVVVLFNPSIADHSIDDPTIKLLCHIANHNGFGGIVVVNGIPLRTSLPDPALEMVSGWQLAGDGINPALTTNLSVIAEHVGQAGAILLGWGALPARTPDAAAWFARVAQLIDEHRQHRTPVVCLGKTSTGHPLHPMARGKFKVKKDANLLIWRRE